MATTWPIITVMRIARTKAATAPLFSMLAFMSGHRRRSAAVALPVTIPPDSASRADDSAGQVAHGSRPTPRSSPGAAGRAFRNASHGWCLNYDVSSRQPAARSAEYSYEPITRIRAFNGRAGLRRLAGFVDLPRGDARNSNPRPFSAPDRAVAVPNGSWSAAER